jgi:prevent-host-death family protein
MASVGVKDLKNRLSDYLRRVRAGEDVVITDRGEPVATLSALDQKPAVKKAWSLVREGKAEWSGGKPAGAARPPRPRGQSVADAVIEDRR